DGKKAAEKLAAVSLGGGEFCGIIPPPAGATGNVAVFRSKNGHRWGPKAEFQIVPAAELPRADAAAVRKRLDALGADGWKLVAATSHAWLFRAVKGGGRWECRVVGDRPAPAEGVFERAAEVSDGWELVAVLDQDTAKQPGAKFVEVYTRQLPPV